MSGTPPESDRNDASPDENEGSMNFVVGTRDNPDGTPVEPTADVERRLKSIHHHASRLAIAHGLDLQDFFEPNPDKLTETEQSQEIKKAANPAMADAAASMFARRKVIKITQSDGTTIEASDTQIRIEALVYVEKALKALASLITSPLKWSGRMSLRCGRWLKGKVVASSDERSA